MEFDIQQNTFSDVYVSPPAKPENLDADVERITQGMGRIVWGMSVFTFRNGDPKAVKYPWKPFGIDRWLYEVKIDPSVFNMAEWEANRYRIIEDRTIDVLGPTPPEWGLKTVLMEAVTCDYMPCDQRFLDWLAMNHQLACSAPTGKFGALAAYRQMMDDSAKEDAEREAEIDRRVDSIIDYAKTHEFEINNRRAYSVPSDKRIIVCQQ